MGALDGKVVLVTGAGNGIGREAALIAANAGAKVVVNDLGGGPRGGDEGSAGPAEATAQEIRAGGGVAIANSDSVTSLAAMQGLVEDALRQLGGLHAVINPAGILRDGMFHKMAEADWDTVVDVHLRGSFNVARASIEHFREQKDGAYVFFTSTSGLYGNVGQTNYAAAKMGIVGLSRVIAQEGARNNVRSNVLAPTAWTRLVAGMPVTDPEQARRREALAQKIRPDQPARFSVALVAPAAANVTGQIFAAAGEEIALYSQPRPIVSASKPSGWSVDSILSEALPRLADRFYSLETATTNSATAPEGSNYTF
jgi:NAD(P)-dependent dehydrogenase (short-subunit alcohol dehydrogenase family)